MANLGALRALAQRMERVVPYRLTPAEAKEFTTFAQKKYSPMARKLSDKEFDLRMKFPEFDDAEQLRAKELIEQLSHEAARYSMLDHAASSIAKARLYGDEDLRARLIRDSNGIPGGIATFYPPSHFEGDPLAHGATYVEHLGATGEPGQGRVLLRGVGLENPTDPLILQSLNFPATTDFYEKRGGWRVPYENQQGSALRSMSLPVFKWERGDQVKEKEGGSVKPQKFQVGGLARFFGKNAPKGLSAMSELGTHSTAPRGALSVVKQKGGNWLTGSVEGALEELKPTPPFQGYLEDYKLWEHAAPEGSIMSRWVRDDGMLLNDYDYSRLSSRPPITSWVDKQLTRYIKNEMATPEDPIRALAERGVLHFEPTMIRERSPLMEKVVGRRETAGFPIQGLADAPLARSWENTTDSLIRNLEARDLSSAERAESFGGKSNILSDAVVHEMNPFASGAGISDVGFNHLIDELANALNPESGLPTRFQIDPAKLHKVSVPQAVQRVHDINQWRAAQKAEADALRANNAATSLVREYPENNPLGLRWVELKSPEVNLDALTPDRVAALTQRGALTAEKQAAIDDALRSSGLSGKQMLEDALKYEGDTMGHCVGGYCDDVLSGRTRIFSLRDAKGQPHVTVEVGPHRPMREPEYDELDNIVGLNSDLENRMYEAVGYEKSPTQYLEWLVDNAPGTRGARAAILLEDLQEAPAYIKQIKYKGNSTKPVPEYLPFVQDFVRNSPLGGVWGEVQDMQSADMFRVHKGQKWPGFSEEMPEGYYTIEEAEKQAREKGMDEEVLSNWIKRLRSPWPPGME